MRKNVYFSERLDEDLIGYMEENNFTTDFSQNVKKLMRDGIKYRTGGITDETAIKDVFQNQLPKFKGVMGDQAFVETHVPTIDFSDIRSTKKEVDIDELEDRFNSI